MADATIKPDSGNDLVLQNNGGSKKIEITNSGNIEVTGAVDFQGNELILDADGDTSISSDTDDQVDVKIAGTDKFSVDANGIRLGPKAGSSTSHNVPYKITVGPYNWSQSNDEISEITMGASSTGSDDGEIKFYTAQNVDSGGILTERLHIENGGDVAVKTGSLVISSSGQGIDFYPGSGTANTLDDYEELTSTILDFGNASNGTNGLTNEVRAYEHVTKIGNLVTISLRVTLTHQPNPGGTNGTRMYIRALPYTPVANSGVNGWCRLISGTGAGTANISEGAIYGADNPATDSWPIRSIVTPAGTSGTTTWVLFFQYISA